jgi:RNA polymerase sigma factor (sigma-70 family)
MEHGRWPRTGAIGLQPASRTCLDPVPGISSPVARSPHGSRAGRGPRERRVVASDARTPFEQAVLPHLDAAYTLARYLLRDEDEARDAVQDAYLRALKYFRGFRGGDGRAWLLAIVRNTCHTRYQRSRATPITTPFDEELHTPDDAGVGAGSSDIDRIPAESVREAVERLPMEFREVVILREVHGYSYREIGEVVGVPVGTVMSRLSRARRRLRDALDPRSHGRASP